jgi:hypothetical protein
LVFVRMMTCGARALCDSNVRKETGIFGKLWCHRVKGHILGVGVVGATNKTECYNSCISGFCRGD